MDHDIPQHVKDRWEQEQKERNRMTPTQLQAEQLAFEKRRREKENKEKWKKFLDSIPNRYVDIRDDDEKRQEYERFQRTR